MFLSPNVNVCFAKMLPRHEKHECAFGDNVVGNGGYWQMRGVAGTKKQTGKKKHKEKQKVEI